MTKKPPVLLLPQNRIAAYMLPSEFDSHPVKERERERERDHHCAKRVPLPDSLPREFPQKFSGTITCSPFSTTQHTAHAECRRGEALGGHDKASPYERS